MKFDIDTDRVSLRDLQKRIEDTDLIPSRQPLLVEIEDKFCKLENHGITNLSKLREEIKNNKRIEALSIRTGISIEYFILLRREIESYLPKPHPLSEFDWISQTEIHILESIDIRDTEELFEAVSSFEDVSDLQTKTGIDPAVLRYLLQLAACRRDNEFHDTKQHTGQKKPLITAKAV